MKQEDIIQKVSVIYFRYKSFVVPCFVIIVCLLLCVFVVVPQISSVLSLQSDIAMNQAKLQVLEQNFQQITGLNNQQLDDSVATATTALPQEKNPIKILSSISHAASVTNLSLKDYSFAVGKLLVVPGQVPLQIQISVDGGLHTVQKFIQNLQNTIPLSTVTSISAQGSESATLTFVFYTRPFARVTLDPNQPLQLLTPQDKATLAQLTQWENQ